MAGRISNMVADGMLSTTEEAATFGRAISSVSRARRNDPAHPAHPSHTPADDAARGVERIPYNTQVRVRVPHRLAAAYWAGRPLTAGRPRTCRYCGQACWAAPGQTRTPPERWDAAAPCRPDVPGHCPTSLRTPREDTPDVP